MYHHSCINSPIRFTGEAVPIFYHHFSNIDVSCLHLLPKSCHHPFHHVGFMTEGFCETRAQQKQALPNVFCVLCWSVDIALWQSSKGWFLMEYYFRNISSDMGLIIQTAYVIMMSYRTHTFFTNFQAWKVDEVSTFQPHWTANVYINPNLTNLRVSQRISQGCPLKVVQFV